jgi:hypothetical protein
MIEPRTSSILKLQSATTIDYALHSNVKILVFRKLREPEGSNYGTAIKGFSHELSR